MMTDQCWHHAESRGPPSQYNNLSPQAAVIISSSGGPIGSTGGKAWLLPTALSSTQVLELTRKSYLGQGKLM